MPGILEVYEELVKIRILLENQAKPAPIEQQITEMLLSLPAHLQLTVRVLAQYGEATASMVSTGTHRTRAVESDYLNQLARLGFVKKERRGKHVWFILDIKAANKQGET